MEVSNSDVKIENCKLLQRYIYVKATPYYRKTKNENLYKHV